MQDERKSHCQDLSAYAGCSTNSRKTESKPWDLPRSRRLCCRNSSNKTWFLTWISNSTTIQATVQERCSILKRCGDFSNFQWKTIFWVLCFGIFVGDVTSGLGFRSFWFRLLGPTARWIFLTRFFVENYARIRVFWAFDWFSDFCGSKVIAWKQHFTLFNSITR